LRRLDYPDQLSRNFWGCWKSCEYIPT